MKVIKASTQKGKDMIDRYAVATATRLSDVYGRWSAAKERAFDNCLRMMYEEDGDTLRIMGANTSTFSVGWWTAEGLRVETASNSYLVTWEG